MVWSGITPVVDEVDLVSSAKTKWLDDTVRVSDFSALSNKCLHRIEEEIRGRHEGRSYSSITGSQDSELF